jgi:hypothetical protein
MTPAELARAAAKDIAITVEVKVAGVSHRADDGRNLRFAVHPQDDLAKLDALKIGQRFYLVMFGPVNDQEEAPYISARDEYVETQ